MMPKPLQVFHFINDGADLEMTCELDYAVPCQFETEFCFIIQYKFEIFIQLSIQSTKMLRKNSCSYSTGLNLRLRPLEILCALTWQTK